MDGRGQEIVFGALVRRLRSQRLRAGNEFLGDSEPPPRQLWDLRERCKLPYPAGFGLEPRLQMNFGRIESPENASSDRKRRLLPVSLFDLFIIG